MNQMIIHIPHAAIHLPFTDGFLISSDQIKEEQLKLTDWHTDDLFGFNGWSDDTEGERACYHVMATFSRLFCDVERFADDSKEVMAQYGMGFLYESTDEGKPMRIVEAAVREKILSTYYDPHHQTLEALADEQLQHAGKAVIVDAHSFPDTPFTRDIDQTQPRPDFNIGTDPFHTPQEWIDLSIRFFENRGYSLGVDWPHKGTIVPLKHYNKESRVQSIMLEINRKLYLKNGSNKKSSEYNEIKRVVTEFLEMIGQSAG